MTIIKKVALGLSGGVDSAVSAYLLKQKGFHVTGIFMKNWDETDEKGFCSSDQEYEDALHISTKLGIPLKQINYVKEYWNEVFCNFIKDYEEGLTPNPDILCNKQIKFNLFFKYAIHSLKFDAIATGHYAQSSFGSFLEYFKDNTDARLLQASDSFKDQTFFLSQIPQNALRRCMFPIGSLNKHQVKEIAEKIGLQKIAQKKESIGICFIGDRTFQSFISEYIDAKPGNFVDIETGKIVGSHQGIHNWTVGQRCNIGGVIKPFFVYRKEPTTSTIYVASGTDNPFLWTDIFYTKDSFWIRNSPLTSKNLLKCQFRFQHTKPLTACTVYKANVTGDKLLIKLEEPLRSITPGQYAVFYLNNECLGSSRIFNSGPSVNIR
ncbi:CLUMA_CG013009, isoform A [Clunio marinus]|uniref:tRNA-5-taurinomethyluridine 2-sulfurtransferase n=1 Tax=Clunio marinus TaxID=568069 RepID=A0A1J1IHL9_9DIPT|nr:CLUMA_CG013009, isoform A [Clunio marinus]